MKNLKRVLAISLAATLCLSGCVKVEKVSNSGTSEQKESTESKENKLLGGLANQFNKDTTNVKGVSFSDLQIQFGSASRVRRVTPLYNVNASQPFTIHFNTMEQIDPMKAVSIHTNEECTEESKLSTINYAYIMDDGVDILLAPEKLHTDVLDCAQRISDQTSTNTWGNAPVYYICINYDLESETTKQLDEKIIIPFTVDHGIAAPTVKATINTDGLFEISWLPVEGATKYRIYREFSGDSNRENRVGYDRNELGYRGTHLEFLAEVDGNTTTFNKFNENNGVDCIEWDGHVISQNGTSYFDYFVTAVKDNEESAFSHELSSWVYGGSLPHKVEDDSLSFTEFTELPKSINVEMVDKSVKSMGVKYTLRNVDYGIATYDYNIQGTLLKDKIKLKVADGVEPEKEINYFVNSGDSSIDLSIPYAFSTTGGNTEWGYKNNYVECNVYDGYNPDSIIKLKEESLDKLLDYDCARIVTNGFLEDDKLAELEQMAYVNLDKYPSTRTSRSSLQEYTEWKDSVLGTSTKVAETEAPVRESEAPVKETEAETVEETEVIKETEATVNETETVEETEAVRETEETVEVEPETTEVYTEPETIEVETEEATEPEVEMETEPETETETEPETETETEPETEMETEPETSGVTENRPEGTEGYVLVDLNNIELTDYDLYADSAEEAYIANALINHDERIPIYGIEPLYDGEYLLDVIFKAYNQNPFAPQIVGMDLDENTLELIVDYTEDKETWDKKKEEIDEKADELVNSLFNSSMSDEDKIQTLWDYLEKNTTYNQEVCDRVLAGGDIIGDDADAFTTYGILCRDYGVCSSYAYTTSLVLNRAGVDCRRITGKLGTINHAWNIINVDGEWYWFDATNNVTAVGIPYWVYMTSGDFAKSQTYTVGLDSELDSLLKSRNMYYTSDESKSFYSKNNLVADEVTDILEIAADNLDKDDMLVIRGEFNDSEYNDMLSESNADAIRSMVMEVSERTGMDPSEVVEKLGFGHGLGFSIVAIQQ